MMGDLEMRASSESGVGVGYSVLSKYYSTAHSFTNDGDLEVDR